MEIILIILYLETLISMEINRNKPNFSAAWTKPRLQRSHYTLYMFINLLFKLLFRIMCLTLYMLIIFKSDFSFDTFILYDIKYIHIQNCFTLM